MVVVCLLERSRHGQTSVIDYKCVLGLRFWPK